MGDHMLLLMPVSNDTWYHLAVLEQPCGLLLISHACQLAQPRPLGSPLLPLLFLGSCFSRSAVCDAVICCICSIQLQVQNTESNSHVLS